MKNISFKSKLLVTGIFMAVFCLKGTGNVGVFHPFQGIAMPLEELIVKSFTEGNASELAGHFASDITLIVLEGEENTDAASAQKALSAFFSKYAPASFEIKHSGSSKGGGEKYIIGSLLTKSRNEFRCYISLKNNKIQSVEISKP